MMKKDIELKSIEEIKDQNLVQPNTIEYIEELFSLHNDALPFHNWAHTKFVLKSSLFFANELGANEKLVAYSSLLHDLNYIVSKNSAPEQADSLRADLSNIDEFISGNIEHINEIIKSSHTAYRDEYISLEAKALSDADTLFKILPTTILIHGSNYRNETGKNIIQQAEKILSEQLPLLERGILFYSDFAKRNYLSWAESNIGVWRAFVNWNSSNLFDEGLLK